MILRGRGKGCDSKVIVRSSFAILIADGCCYFFPVQILLYQ